jgi:hypothetical protein
MFNQHLENFHADTWQLENAWNGSDQGWSKFYNQLALALFPEQSKKYREALMDSDQRIDGLSLDQAYDYWEQGFSVEQAATELRLLMAAVDGRMI